MDRYGYDVWGQLPATQTSETVAQPFRYASYWCDKELCWYWVTLHSYNPTLGHWLQPDPSVAGGGRDCAGCSPTRPRRAAYPTTGARTTR